MSTISFDIADWFVGAAGDPRELAALRITVGPQAVPVTEVDDTLAKTVRRHIYVPAYDVARWLVVNWWRLRWEPQRKERTFDWLLSHSMAGIGGGHAWPALTFASDGERIRLQLSAEASPDVAAIRYLNNIDLSVPAADFERAVDQFVDQVEARLALLFPEERELTELRAELADERKSDEQASLCKLQAIAGIDPGAAPHGWTEAARRLIDRTGILAAQEIVAANVSLEEAESVIAAMQRSPTVVTLESAHLYPSVGLTAELPWERGEREAAALRARVGIDSGPISQKRFEDLLSAKIPAPTDSWHGSRELLGGYRHDVKQGHTSVLMTARNEGSQRFYLARLIGAAVGASGDQHVLPVSTANTALQKFERAFAGAFLCPWAELDAYTDEHGTDEDAVADAAKYFMVSEVLIVTTLVNKAKIPRSRLQG